MLEGLLTLFTVPQLASIAILVTALLFFIQGRLGYDVVSLGALIACVLAGLVPPKNAFLGFGHPAVITVLAILILSRVITQSGAIDAIAHVLKLSQGGKKGHLLLLLLLVTFFSAFMNNIAALVLFIPLALRYASSQNTSPSQVLMPLSFGSLLGGLATMIGTPPNIIVANFRETVVGEPFGMFDFAYAGGGVALVGILFITFIGRRFLPDRGQSTTDALEKYQLSSYVTEVILQKESVFIGKMVSELEDGETSEFSIIEIIRGKRHIVAPSAFEILEEKDTLIIKGNPQSLKNVLFSKGIKVPDQRSSLKKEFELPESRLVEALVLPDSKLIGHTLKSLKLHKHYGLTVLGVFRNGQPIMERLKSLVVAPGDILLFHGRSKSLSSALDALACMDVGQPVQPPMRRMNRILPPLIIFAFFVTLASLQWVSVSVAFIGAMVSTAIYNKEDLRDVYKAIDWSLIIFIGSLITVGETLHSTGVTKLISDALLVYAEPLPLPILIGILLVVTMLLSDVINNVVTAVIMLPIAADMAQTLGYSIDPFLMAVAIGSSCTFLTPIGHHSNALVMGPGNYRFGDYWRMGLPLDICIVVTAVPLILFFWPP